MGRIIDVARASRSGGGKANKHGAGTAGVRFAWDANPVGDNVDHYNLYYGSASGVYNGGRSPIDVTDVTSYDAWQPIDMSGTVYFALTAVDASDVESDFSDELSKVF